MRRLLAISVLVVSCTKATPTPGFTLRISGVGPLDPLVPRLASSYTMLVKGFVFSLLLEPRLGGGWQSHIASDWVRLGPSRYRLKLEPSLRFSDGLPVQAGQVISSLAAFGLRGIEREGGLEIEPIDPGTPIDALLLHAVLFKNSPNGPIGTGPFAVESQDTQRIVLRRLKPLAHRISVVELISFPARDAFARALRGEINALPMLDPGQIELLDGVSRFRVIRAEGIHSIAGVFNARRLGTAERKALSQSLPVAELAKVHGGNCRPAEVGPRTPFGAGSSLSLVVPEWDLPMLRIGLALRRALGSRAALMEVPNPASAAKRTIQGLFDIMVGPLQVWPPSASAVHWHSGIPTNLAGYSNPSVDGALDAGDYAKAEQELAKDPPAIIICRREVVAAIDSRIKNPRLGPYDLFGSLPEWEVSP